MTSLEDIRKEEAFDYLCNIAETGDFTKFEIAQEFLIRKYHLIDLTTIWNPAWQSVPLAESV